MSAALVRTMPPPSAVASAPFAVEPKPRRRLTAWELLVWAYRDQRIGGIYGTDQLDDHEPHACSTDGVAAMLRLAEVGCHIDGGEWRTLGDRFHPDARTVALAMAQYAGLEGFAHARLIAEHATQGERPERPTVTPTPFPMAADRAGAAPWAKATEPGQRGLEEFYERGIAHGVAMDVRIRVAERVVTTVPRMEFRGRGRRVEVGQDIVSMPVGYCPLEWWPSLAMVEHGHAICDEFDAGLAQIRALLDEYGLIGHVVEG